MVLEKNYSKKKLNYLFFPIKNPKIIILPLSFSPLPNFPQPHLYVPLPSAPPTTSNLSLAMSSCIPFARYAHAFCLFHLQAHNSDETKQRHFRLDSTFPKTRAVEMG